ncbi:beta-mannosidase [Planifilum fimeticola]|jgi:beta-mannosidase|uniref:beta-mannosidase n=2 Tax=Planifilum fimeticola TaxID=201975 RepID=A0A2T0LFG9_9BACL|nr:beta-mannosidase [Planifilum fimeticola]
MVADLPRMHVRRGGSNIEAAGGSSIRPQPSSVKYAGKGIPMELLLNGMWEYAVGEGDSEDAAFPRWEGTIRIPSNWVQEGLEKIHGPVWFRRVFRIDRLNPDQRYFLQFKGVDYFHEVFLNGKKVGEHEGYFQCHEFDVTDVLREGENELVSKVISPREEPGTVWPDRKRLIKGVFSHHDARPGGCFPETGQDQTTGGIWNDVRLYSTPPVKLERCKITPHLRERDAVVTVETRFAAFREEAVTVRFRIEPDNFSSDSVYERVITRHMPPGVHTLYTAITIDEPKLWWTWDQGDPSLYRLVVSHEVDGQETKEVFRFGLREVRQDGDGKVFLNSREIFLRGTNYIPTQWLSRWTEKDFARDLKMMREAHINAIRVHAHVTREEFYRACDEQGFFVWQDFALQWSYEESDEFVESAVSQIKDMVNQLYNHASILLWCCHNEPSSNEKYLDPLLAHAVREEDGKRIVKESSGYAEHVYPGWYVGEMRDFVTLPGAPFVTEFGAQALPSHETMKSMMAEKDLWPPNWDVWAYHNFQYDQMFHVAGVELGHRLEDFIENSQQYQAELLKFAIEHYRRHKGKITGLFQFMFVDCWPGITWSVVDVHRRPKKGYGAMRLAYAPLLVSMERERTRVLPGFALFKRMVAVNDYPREFSDVSVEVRLEDEAGRTVMERRSDRTWDIGPNGVTVLIDTGLKPEWKVPEDLPPGEYIVVASLVQGECVLTSNRESITVCPPPKKRKEDFRVH